MNNTAGSIACNMPTCELKEGYSTQFGVPVLIDIKGQEVLNKIRELHDQYLDPSTTTDEFGREVEKPALGNDFMIKTNSVAPTRRTIGLTKPIPTEAGPPPPKLDREID